MEVATTVAHTAMRIVIDLFFIVIPRNIVVVAVALRIGTLSFTLVVAVL